MSVRKKIRAIDMRIENFLITGYTVDYEDCTIEKTPLRVLITDNKYGKRLSVGDARVQFIIPLEEIAEYLK